MTARKLKNVFRFIDDLNAVNDNNIFLDNINNIYPPELELSKENTNEHEATFLDLRITIKENKFDVSLFDKRNDFNFDIVRMPFKSSNIPSNMFYNTISAECLRIARTCNKQINFARCITPLLLRMLKQGAIKSRIISTLRKSYNRHFNIYSKIADTFQSFSALLFG